MPSRPAKHHAAVGYPYHTMKAHNVKPGRNLEQAPVCGIMGLVMYNVVRVGRPGRDAKAPSKTDPRQSLIHD